MPSRGSIKMWNLVTILAPLLCLLHNCSTDFSSMGFNYACQAFKKWHTNQKSGFLDPFRLILPFRKEPLLQGVLFWAIEPLYFFLPAGSFSRWSLFKKMKIEALLFWIQETQIVMTNIFIGLLDMTVRGGVFFKWT